MHNHTKVVGPQLFWAADFVGYNLIFRYLWLVEADLKICFKTGIFKWWNNQESEGYISVITLKHIINNIALSKIIYVLHPKKYWIQPLFHNKMGMGPNIGDTPYTTDILWGTARQAVDIQQRGGDFKDLMKYFQH